VLTSHCVGSQWCPIVLGVSDVFEMFHYARNHPHLFMSEANNIKMGHQIRSQPTVKISQCAAAET